MASSPHKRAFVISSIAALVALIYANADSCTDDATCTSSDGEPLGRYSAWEDAPHSSDEFDHDNNKRVCGLPILTVEEWETGRFWESEKPVMVKNVTDGWKALEHWTKYVVA